MADQPDDITLKVFDGADAIGEVAKLEASKISCAWVGEVTAYNASNRTATVRPVLRDRQNLQWQDLPPIANLPVQFPGGGEFDITWPLVPGDRVLCSTSDRDLTTWLRSGEAPTTPQSFRTHKINDSVVGLRVFPISSQRAASSEGIEIKHSSGTIIKLIQDEVRISVGGAEFSVKGGFVMTNGGDNLFQVLRDMVTLMASGLNVGGNPVVPNDGTDVINLNNSINNLEAS